MQKIIVNLLKNVSLQHFVMNIHKYNWYVLKTRPSAEKKVAERLQLIGLESFLPLQAVWKQWSDRKKKNNVAPNPFHHIYSLS